VQDLLQGQTVSVSDITIKRSCHRPDGYSPINMDVKLEGVGTKEGGAFGLVTD